MEGNLICYKFISDDRKAIILKHSEICYPPAIHQDLVDRVDTSYPGIVIKYDTGYLLEDGVHRIAKFQQQQIYESLFYIVSVEEYKQGVVHMMLNGKVYVCGEWSNYHLDPIPHQE